ncbi:MAG: FAD-dependent oxidoreductase [Venatoribacter sp.]
MNSHAPIVVIGTGLAGYHLVKELRKLAPEQAILMITADDGRSYSKPMLSTGFSKNKSADELAIANAAEMAAQLNITVRTHTLVTAINPAAHTLNINDEVVAYSKLVLAMGAEVIRVPVAGDAQDKIFSINDLQDYATFRKHADGKNRVVIMGGGLIGCEYANDMREGGFEVDLVSLDNHLLPALLPAPAADALQQGLENIGIRFHLGRTVQAVNHGDDGVVVETSAGDKLNADLVVSAIGLRSKTAIAKEAGIAINRGIQVNRLLETSQPDIYALGDCAEVDGLVMHFVLPLMTCARTLAKTLAGTPTQVSYGVMPVTIKTPANPVVVSPPASGSEGNWHINADGLDLQAEFRDNSGQLLGYALTGSKGLNKVALNKELPAILL